MWRESGVDIPKYGFTGDVYKWGERIGTAYNRGSLAEQARPGDAILFGTRPTWAGSEHIGNIEKVDGNKITTIEGGRAGHRRGLPGENRRTASRKRRPGWSSSSTRAAAMLSPSDRSRSRSASCRLIAGVAAAFTGATLSAQPLTP
jgi:hypothetical protein